MPLLLLHFYYLSTAFYDSILPPRLAEVRREPTKLCHWGLSMQGKKNCRNMESPSSPPPSGIFAFPVLSQRYSSLWMQIATIKGFFFFQKSSLLKCCRAHSWKQMMWQHHPIYEAQENIRTQWWQRPAPCNSVLFTVINNIAYSVHPHSIKVYQLAYILPLELLINVD